MLARVSVERLVYRSSVANSLAPLSLHITPIISCRRMLPAEETRRHVRHRIQDKGRRNVPNRDFVLLIQKQCDAIRVKFNIKP